MNGAPYIVPSDTQIKREFTEKVAFQIALKKGLSIGMDRVRFHTMAIRKRRTGGKTCALFQEQVWLQHRNDEKES